MKAVIAVTIVIFSFYAESHQHENSPQMLEIFNQALSETGGACNLSEPHSYACNQWNFVGNTVFPLMPLDGFNGSQGEWFAVTYVNSLTENIGEEFYMAKNPARPSQPLGVVNTQTGVKVGSMWIVGNSLVWENWLGYQFSTDPHSLVQLDAYTVEVSAYEGEYVHKFTCRDFNRNNNHHLLCKWTLWMPEYNQWHNKGFLGFLTRQAWDAFATGQH